MGAYTGYIIYVIYLVCLSKPSYTDKTCSPEALFECSVNETCTVTDAKGVTGVCKCKLGYKKAVADGPCILIPSPDVGPHSPNIPDQPLSTPSPPVSSFSVPTVVAGVVIPLLLVGTIGMVLAARRYHWLQRLHHLRVRRYDEVRIGQDDDDDDDDPPLA